MPKAFKGEPKRRSPEDREKLSRFMDVMEKIIKVFPNTKENHNKRKWSHCPICGGRLNMYREPTKGHLRAQCETKGCFQAME